MKEKSAKKISEEIWAKYKYEVLSKSPNIYWDIRNYLKNDDVKVEEVYRMIFAAQKLEENRNHFRNAAEHIWGYFKKVATLEEKKDFLILLDNYNMGKIDSFEIIKNFQKLLDKYPNSYLENSTIIRRKE